MTELNHYYPAQVEPLERSIINIISLLDYITDGNYTHQTFPLAHFTRWPLLWASASGG